MVNSNKTFGLFNHHPENYLLIIVSTFNLVNALGRLVLGILNDYISFRPLYLKINIINIIVSGSILRSH